MPQTYLLCFLKIPETAQGNRFSQHTRISEVPELKAEAEISSRENLSQLPAQQVTKPWHFKSCCVLAQGGRHPHPSQGGREWCQQE